MIELSCKLMEELHTATAAEKAGDVQTSIYTQPTELGGWLVMDEGGGRQNATPSASLRC